MQPFFFSIHRDGSQFSSLTNHPDYYEGWKLGTSISYIFSEAIPGACTIEIFIPQYPSRTRPYTPPTPVCFENFSVFHRTPLLYGLSRTMSGYKVESTLELPSKVFEPGAGRTRPYFSPNPSPHLSQSTSLYCLPARRLRSTSDVSVSSHIAVPIRSFVLSEGFSDWTCIIRESRTSVRDFLYSCVIFSKILKQKEKLNKESRNVNKMWWRNGHQESNGT